MLACYRPQRRNKNLEEYGKQTGCAEKMSIQQNSNFCCFYKVNNEQIDLFCLEFFSFPIQD